MSIVSPRSPPRARSSTRVRSGWPKKVMALAKTNTLGLPQSQKTSPHHAILKFANPKKTSPTLFSQTSPQTPTSQRNPGPNGAASSSPGLPRRKSGYPGSKPPNHPNPNGVLPQSHTNSSAHLNPTPVFSSKALVRTAPIGRSQLHQQPRLTFQCSAFADLSFLPLDFALSFRFGCRLHFQCLASLSVSLVRIPKWI